MIRKLILGMLLLGGVTRGWAQAAQPAGGDVPSEAVADQPMMTPPTVNSGGASVAFTSELERSNFLRGQISVQGAYDDNIFTSVPAEGDTSYTISPTIAFNMTRSRLKWDTSYSPGFAFFHRFSSDDQVDHAFYTDLQYQMSPHVTLTLQDNLTKTPSFSGLLQPGNTGNTVSSSPTFFVVPPLVDTLTNSGSGQLNYQFGPNAMVGFGGSATELYFLGHSQASGLSDSSSEGAQAFYTYRMGGKHYIGVNYNFEDMVAHPSNLETQIHSTTFFYTFYLSKKVSFSVFGGAQHADVSGGGFPSFVEWIPTEGGSINLQGIHNSLALSVSHSINAGGGLTGPVRSYNGNATFRHQFTEHLTGILQTSYSKNDELETLFGSSGRTYLFSGSLQQSLGGHFSAELGYTRVNQRYANIGAIASNPDIDREWITISYKFERPLGR
jgi:hypothetical protein